MFIRIDLGSLGPSASSWRPPETTLRVSCLQGVCKYAFRVCNVVRYCVMVFVLSCLVSLLNVCKKSGKSGLRDRTESLGSKFHPASSAIAPLGAVPLVGESLILRYQGRLERLSRDAGGPWAPPPRCVFLKVVLSLCLFWFMRQGLCLGSLKSLLFWDFYEGSVVFKFRLAYAYFWLLSLCFSSC